MYMFIYKVFYVSSWKEFKHSAKQVLGESGN